MGALLVLRQYHEHLQLWRRTGETNVLTPLPFFIVETCAPTNDSILHTSIGQASRKRERESSVTLSHLEPICHNYGMLLWYSLTSLSIVHSDERFLQVKTRANGANTFQTSMAARLDGANTFQTSMAARLDVITRNSRGGKPCQQQEPRDVEPYLWIL